MRLLGAALLVATLASAAPNEACVIAVSKAIARAEGLGEAGSIAQRQNNPGCLRRANGEYLSFPTPGAGRDALYATVRSKLRRIGLGMLDRWSETPGYFGVIRGYAGKRWVACAKERGYR